MLSPFVGVLIVGVLAAVATPPCLGCVKGVKAAEGKSQVGAIWTSLQARTAKLLGISERSLW